METLEKNEPCYVQNHDNKKINVTLNINGNVIDIVQRRLTGGEVQKRANDLQDVYMDKDIYMTQLKREKLAEEAERLQKIEDKKKVKDRKKVIVPVDDETQYLLYKGRRAIERANRNVNAKFIAYSCSDSELEGGSFLYNGKDVSFDRKLKIIDELGIEKDENGVDVNLFNLLLDNANKLSFPTEKEIQDAK